MMSYRTARRLMGARALREAERYRSDRVYGGAGSHRTDGSNNRCGGRRIGEGRPKPHGQYGIQSVGLL